MGIVSQCHHYTSSRAEEEWSEMTADRGLPFRRACDWMVIGEELQRPTYWMTATT